jgi:hypothetical protein
MRAVRLSDATASLTLSSAGRMRRAALVLTSKGGMATTATSSAGMSKRWQRRPPDSSATTVKPPRQAAATLSGWPSRAAAMRISSGLSRGRPARRWQAAAQPSRMVEELPMPRAIGTAPSTRTLRPGSAQFQRSLQAARTAAAISTRPGSALPGAWSGPAGTASTLMRLAAPRAMPRQSKPGPRLVVEAGTMKVGMAAVWLARRRRNPGPGARGSGSPRGRAAGSAGSAGAGCRRRDAGIARDWG